MNIELVLPIVNTIILIGVIYALRKMQSTLDNASSNTQPVSPPRVGPRMDGWIVDINGEKIIKISVDQLTNKTKIDESFSR